MVMTSERSGALVMTFVDNINGDRRLDVSRLWGS